MTQENYLQEVREQYENYPYPMVNPEDERKRVVVPITEAVECLNYYCFSGKRDFRKGFRVLVAGGGTGDAVIALAEQLRGMPAEIIYVDMSLASMKIAQERASIRGLSNIRWINDSLLNISTLGLGEFDYVNCSGVLHHLADPSAGLKILSDSLKPDGAMALMLYAKYGRMAVYMMQEALRLINHDEPNLQKRVENTKSILNFLPQTNWFYHSPPPIIGEIRSGDVGIYDLLLHSQDRAYTVPELYEYTEKEGLKVVHLFSDDRMLGPNLYDPAFYIKDPRIVAQVRKLDIRYQQGLAELLNSQIIKHTFYAAKNVAPLPSTEDFDNIPVLGFDIFTEQATLCDIISKATDIVLLRQPSTNIEIILTKTPHLEFFFRFMDGKRTLKEIFRIIMDSNEGKKHKPNFQTLSFEFNAMFATLNARNWLFLRHKTTAPIIYPIEMQERVTKA
jgi:ubiquinone/menaquinone biosynthesis C-methylase UbiE